MADKTPVPNRDKIVPHRFLWVMQGLVHNFCHIFHPDERPRKPGESACYDRIAEATAFSTSIVCLPSASLRR